MQSKRSFITWLAVLLLVVPAITFAQEQGRLIGKVVDVDGKPIKGVVVVATATTLPSYRAQDTSDKRGVFKIDFSELDVVYHLLFQKEGYATMETNITWQLNGTARQEFTMHPAGAVELGTMPVSSTSNPAISAFNAGVAAFKAGDNATAETQFRAAVKNDPKLRQAWEGLSVAALRHGDYQDAADAAEKAMALGSTDETVLRTRWEAYRKLGDEAKAAAALQDIEKAGQVAAQAKGIYNDGVALLKAGNDEAALQKFQEAIDLDQNLRVALDAVATTALKLGHNEQASAAAEKILAQDPGNAEALKLRYNAALALGDQDKLVNALVGLATVDPKVAHDGLLKLAFEAYDKNDMATAKARFTKVLDLDPDDGVAHYYLAITDVNLGDNAAAKAHLERFLQLSPGNKEAQSAKEMLDYLNKQQ